MIKAFLFEISRPTVIVYYIATVFIFGFAGPFGTFEETVLGQRFAFWAWVIGVAIVLGLVVRVVFLKLIGPESFWVREVFCISSFSITFTPILWGSVHWFSTDPTLIPFNYIGMFAFVVMVAILSVTLETVITGNRGVTPMPETVAPQTASALLDRIPAEKRGQILSLSAKDHYVDVTMNNGNEPVLIRLADAIAQLNGLAGAQVHRSHWVARHAVAGSTQRRGQLFLTLTNGEEIPVSRSYRKTVETDLL